MCVLHVHFPIRDASGAIVGGCEQSVCQNVVLNISPGLLRFVRSSSVPTLVCVLRPAGGSLHNCILCDALLIHRNIVGVTMSMVIMFSYLVILAPAREHIENTLLGYVVLVIPLT